MYVSLFAFVSDEYVLFNYYNYYNINISLCYAYFPLTD